MYREENVGGDVTGRIIGWRRWNWKDTVGEDQRIGLEGFNEKDGDNGRRRL